MKSFALMLYLLLTSTLLLAAGSSRVTWLPPEQYTDVKSSDGNQEEFLARTLKLLETEILKQAKKYLPDGQSIEISVTDLDLAGDLRMTGARQGHSDVRLVKDIYPAKMQFHYRVLDASGQVLEEDDANLRSRMPSGSSIRASSNKPLSIERKMISNWFKTRFK